MCSLYDEIAANQRRLIEFDFDAAQDCNNVHFHGGEGHLLPGNDDNDDDHHYDSDSVDDCASKDDSSVDSWRANPNNGLKLVWEGTISQRRQQRKTAEILDRLWDQQQQQQKSKELAQQRNAGAAKFDRIPIIHDNDNDDDDDIVVGRTPTREPRRRRRRRRNRVSFSTKVGVCWIERAADYSKQQLFYQEEDYDRFAKENAIHHARKAQSRLRRTKQRRVPQNQPQNQDDDDDDDPTPPQQQQQRRRRQQQQQQRPDDAVQSLEEEQDLTKGTRRKSTRPKRRPQQQQQLRQTTAPASA